jgi:hypothetical protein
LLDGDTKFDFDKNLCHRLDSYSKNSDSFSQADSDLEDEEEEIRRLEVDEETLKRLADANLPNYSHVVPTVSDGSRYIEIVDSARKRKVFKKTTVVWYFDEELRKQSNDRSIRVRQEASVPRPNGKRNGYVERGTIKPGDWCVFQGDEGEGLLLGRVLFLSLLTGTRRELSKPIDEWIEPVENVGAQCIWYTFSHNGTNLSPSLTQSPVFSHGLCPCEMYLCSIPPPTEMIENGVRISTDTLQQLTAFLASLGQ